MAQPPSRYVEAPSHYLQYLPAIYQKDEFLGRFLCVFEELLRPVEDVLTEIACYFDPDLTPSRFLPWLARCIGMALDDHWDESRRRELIRRGAELYRWRGTKRGLTDYLSIYAGPGAEIEVIADTGPETFKPFHFSVVVRVKDRSQVEKKLVRAIIEAEKPAHTTYTLQWAEPRPQK